MEYYGEYDEDFDDNAVIDALEHEWNDDDDDDDVLNTAAMESEKGVEVSNTLQAVHDSLLTHIGNTTLLYFHRI